MLDRFIKRIRLTLFGLVFWGCSTRRSTKYYQILPDGRGGDPRTSKPIFKKQYTFFCSIICPFCSIICPFSSRIRASCCLVRSLYTAIFLSMSIILTWSSSDFLWSSAFFFWSFVIMSFLLCVCCSSSSFIELWRWNMVLFSFLFLLLFLFWSSKFLFWNLSATLSSWLCVNISNRSAISYTDKNIH